MNEDIKVIINIAKKNGLGRDDLIQEAECVEEYGEYLHMSLIGFGEDQLREAAEHI